jgi:hypothetical protein
MKTRYRLIRRGNRSGAFYCVDTKTGKRTSLRKANEDAAKRGLHTPLAALLPAILDKASKGEV